jgi:hypothetical protein
MKRTLKRIVYGLFYLCLLGAVGWGIYALFFKPAPSCTNKKQDVNEEGVDCGVVCGTYCIPAAIRPVNVVGTPVIFISEPGIVTALVEVRNENTDFAAKQLPYEFVVRDDAGTVLGNKVGETVLYGGEIKYLIETIPVDKTKTPSQASLFAGTPSWVPASALTKPRLGQLTGETTREGNRIVLRGSIASEEVIPIPKVRIVAVFLSELGIPAGASWADLPQIEAGAHVPFTIFYPDPGNIDLTRTKVIATPLLP